MTAHGGALGCMVEVGWGEGSLGRGGQYLLGLGCLIFWDSVFSSKMGIMMPNFQDQMKSCQYIFLNREKTGEPVFIIIIFEGSLSDPVVNSWRAGQLPP